MDDNPALSATLHNARQDLLDLTTRNRLLNTARRRTRSSRLEIVDERSDEVFRILVTEHRAMSFLPRPEADPDTDPGAEAEDMSLLLAQPEDDEAEGLAARYTDDKLQTQLTSEHLQKRLLKLFYDARALQEEQGVNILYLACGFLRWYEDDHSDRERYAPLLLIPVQLDRTSATSRFKIRYSDDDITTNLSLQARIKSDFGLDLPEVPDIEELAPSAYFDQVARAVGNQPRWQVLPNDMVLWFFSFSKFLMYRDLDPDNWPPDRTLQQHPIITALLHDGFQGDPPLFGENEKIDDVLPPLEMVHILDADSSQTVVIEEAKQGRNLVIQGPPGTGKSQTITNVIAAAVKAGKTVLFVAEKLAALEVVQRRLANIGLADMCLELHSNKANKRAMLQELGRTLQLGKPVIGDVGQYCNDLAECRARINHYVEIIHTPLQPAEFTPYQIVGRLVQLRAEGTRPASFTLDCPLTWTRDDYRVRLGLLRDFAQRLDEIGVPSEHPWRGVQLNVVLPTDVDRVTAQLPELVGQLETLCDAATRLAALLAVDTPLDAAELARLARLAKRIATAPPMDRSSLAHDVWADRREQIDELVHAGETLANLREQLADVVVEAAWDMDLAAVRRDLAAYGRSWFRWLNGKYRQAQAALRGILVQTPPKDLDQRLEIVDALISARRAQHRINSPPMMTLGRRAFGTLFTGDMSDWNVLAAIGRWEAECRAADVTPNFRQVVAALESIPDCGRPLATIRTHVKPAVNRLRTLLKTLQLDTQTAFGQHDAIRIPLGELISRLQLWQATPESLSQWVAYRIRQGRLNEAGLGGLLPEVHNGSISADEVVPMCEMAYFEALIRSVLSQQPDLAGFSGTSHEQRLARFRELDVGRIELARREVALAHYEKLPKADTDVGEVGLVRREIQKKRRHLPIRRLLAQAGRAVQAIKPVFMMSPISVAQYLEPGAITFDLLLIDEASQVPPVDALGAVARARQVVVVGDSKQLPPTRFFSRMMGDEPAESGDDDLEIHTSDVESILGLCCAQNMPQRMLSWHYRSRHHSLIAVSNHEFYDDRLFVVPSPGPPNSDQGLMFHFVADGLFDRGGSATNRVEARRVAEAVMEHARRFPHKTLGVGTFSVAQRDAILDQLELLRRRDPSLESFFVTGTPEPFFVKNLENIQGDERDVIMISVGYGKDAAGYFSMNFGPLSKDGGERRLNVLITRARDCCAVYSSIRADDINLERARARGAHALKVFLKYAETGLLDTGTEHANRFDSEFERQVAKALAAVGYETRSQVSVAGFFIDLAVIDPDQPGRYVLGIECDGANYHSSRSARDRDRLRQAVLESRNWVIHRIWSTDWFHRPEDELRKTVAAIEQARIRLAGQARGTAKKHARAVSRHGGIQRRQPSDSDEEGNGACPTKPYQIASFRIHTNLKIHELPETELARVICRIVDVEGPIHEDEIARRVTQLWGLQRTGKRIRQAVDRALPAACRDGVQVVDGRFYAPRNLANCPIRDRSEVPSSTLRQPEMLPPLEIRNAVRAIVQVHLGIARADAVVETAHLFGFRSTSARMRKVIEHEIDHLLANRTLFQRADEIYASENESP